MDDRREEKRHNDLTPNDHEAPGMDLENPEVASLDGMEDDPERIEQLEDSPVGFVQVDIDREDAPEGSASAGEEDEDQITIGTNRDLVMDEIDNYTDDPDVLDDFAERQDLAGHSEDLLTSLREHTDKSPGISGTDIDANWERADQVGEEAAGGTVATPDQDIVEDLGEALGITYSDTERLATEDKLEARDQNRWELNPASADDELRAVDELYDEVEELDARGLVDEEDLDLDDEDELEDLVDEIDDDLLEDEDELEDEDDFDEEEVEDELDDEDDYDDEDLDDLDDDFLLGGIDDDEDI